MFNRPRYASQRTEADHEEADYEEADSENGANQEMVDVPITPQ